MVELTILLSVDHILDILNQTKTWKKLPSVSKVSIIEGLCPSTTIVYMSIQNFLLLCLKTIDCHDLFVDIDSYVVSLFVFYLLCASISVGIDDSYSLGS